MYHIVVSDPLQLMKRISYGWIRRPLSFGLGEEELLFFFTKRNHEAEFLSPVVFLRSQLSKIHNSLPLQLFSTSTLAVIFRDVLRAEFSMASWCLLLAALTLQRS
jgi:hypothetical protein